MFNSLAFLVASTIGQIFVVNPQIPVVQYQSTVAVVNTVRFTYPVYYNQFYTPTAVLYSNPYGLSPYPYYPYQNFYNTVPYNYPYFRIFP